MKLLKWLFGSRKPALNKPVVSSSYYCAYCGGQIKDAYMPLGEVMVHNTVNCCWGYSKKTKLTFRNIKVRHI